MADREAQDEAAHAATIAVFRVLLETFGKRWADDPGAPSADPAAIAVARETWAVPASNGAAVALAQFCWLTAPPGATAQQLANHLQGIIHQGFLATYEFAEAGDFWAHVERYLKEASDGGVT